MYITVYILQGWGHMVCCEKLVPEIVSVSVTQEHLIKRIVYNIYILNVNFSQENTDLKTKQTHKNKIILELILSQIEVNSLLYSLTLSL